MLSSYIEFVKAALRNPLQISTVFQTSTWLCKKLLSRARVDEAKLIVELGPGAGAITQALYGQLPKDCRYVGIELNASLVEYLRARFPEFEFIHGSAESCSQVADKYGPIDVAISSLPWTVFPKDLQDEITSALATSLKPGGTFVTYVCLNAALYPAAKNLFALLKKKFSNVHKSSVEWRNIPPAFVYTCTK